MKSIYTVVVEYTPVNNPRALTVIHDYIPHSFTANTFSGSLHIMRVRKLNLKVLLNTSQVCICCPKKTFTIGLGT